MNFEKLFHFPILIMKLENEKRKNFKIRFGFKSKNELYFQYMVVVNYLNFVFHIEVKTKSNHKFLNFVFQFIKNTICYFG